MIFKIQNDELVIFGNTLDEIKNKWDNFANSYKASNGNLFSTHNLTIDDELINDFEAFKDLFNQSSLSAEALAEELGGVDENIVNYAKTCKNGTLTTKGFVSSVNNMSLSAKAGKIAIQGLTMAANMLAGMLISAGISIAINAIVKGFQKLVNVQEEAIEKANELIDEFNEQKNVLTSTKKTIDSISYDYEKLSKGVDSLGKNISLSSEEYSKYNDIVNQIADMFPQMIQGYTEEGIAILEHKGNVEELTKAYEEQRKAAQDAIIVGSSDVFKGYKAKVNHDADFTWEESGLYQMRTIGQDLIEGLLSDDFDYGYFRDANSLVLDDFLKYAGIDLGVHWTAAGDEKELNEQREKILSAIRTLDTEINAETLKIKPIMQAYLDRSLESHDVDEKTQELVKQMINQFDNEFYKQFDNETDMATYIDIIVEKLSGADEETKKIFSDLFSTDFSELPINEAKTQIDSLIESIAGYLGEDALTLKIRLGFDEYDNLASNYNTVIDNAAKKFAGGNKINNGASAKAYQENYQKEKQALDDFARENKINTQDQIAFWNQCLEESLTREDAMKKYLQESISETTPPPTITETVDAINNELKPALESLKGSYTSIFSEDGFKAGNVDIDDITSIKSALDNLKEEYKLDIDYEEYEDFVKVITDTDAEASDVQEAFNSMASMMVNASSAVKLTEENFDLLQTQLENLGITNAKEVLSDIKNVQEELAAQGIDLYHSSLKQAEGFIAVAEAGSTATHYLQMYWLEKELANNPLNTSADIAALEQTCSALNITGEYWKSLIRLKSLYYAAEHGGLGTELQDEIQQEKANLDALYKDQYKYKVDLEFDGNIGGSGSGGGSGSEYDWKNLLDKEIAVLEKQLDAGLIDFDTYLGKRLDLIEKYYQEGKIKAEDYYEYLEKTCENQLSIYDRVISAVTNKLEKQIEQLEKQKEAIEEGYQLQIDKLNEEIELLEKEYQKKKDLEELEQARFNAEKARNQRTKRVK